MPPQAARTAEAVDLSAGAAIVEDPGAAATRTWVQILMCEVLFLLYPAYECRDCFFCETGWL